MARTSVTNTSGEAKHFAFLPPHGVNMADGEERVFDGDLLTVLAGGRNRYTRRTEVDALDAAVLAGDLVVENLLDLSSSSGP